MVSAEVLKGHTITQPDTFATRVEGNSSSPWIADRCELKEVIKELLSALAQLGIGGYVIRRE
jgi:hypothetical protein